MAKSPQSVAQKWVNNLSNATTSIREGVEAVTTAPTEKAAARSDAYVAGVQRAVQDGKWQNGLRRVTLADWQRSMLDKGLTRVASGASAAKPKMEEFLSDFLPFVEQGKAAIDRELPRGDAEQNIQRAVAMMRHNMKFKRRA